MEDMKKIAVSELKPGIKFDQPVFIDAYNILLESRRVLEQKDMDFLRQWGIQELKTYGKLFDSLESKGPGSGAVSGGAASISNYDEELLLIRHKNQYESFRKKISVFSKDLHENCALLERSFKDFLGKQIPQAHHIEQVADSLVEYITNFPLLLILLRHHKFSSNWIICHLVHAAGYGVLLARGLGYGRPDIRNLAAAMLTMDIGMFAIPGSIRGKDKALEDEEIKLIKKHPLLSYRLLYSASSSKSVKMANIALQHHESYDGSGYPRGLKGENIDQDAMLAKICDVYTAMIEKRSFRERVLPAQAIKNILSHSAQRFDPNILRVFVREISDYPIGSFVRLDNGCVAMVIASHSQKPNSPVLRLMRDPQKKHYPQLQFMDMSHKSSLKIEDAVAPISVGIDILKEL